jgi:6,7-dimethyl-8-ribityllumazine synthase
MSRLREVGSGSPAEDMPQDVRFAIVASETNAEVTDALVAGALATFEQQGVAPDAVRVVRVAGAYELPMTAAKLIRTHVVDGVVCIGAIVRGETPHFEYLAMSVAIGIQSVAIDSGVPVTFGVLTCDTLDQALARSGGAKGNKGSEAALATIELAGLYSDLMRE